MFHVYISKTKLGQWIKWPHSWFGIFIYCKQWTKLDFVVNFSNDSIKKQNKNKPCVLKIIQIWHGLLHQYAETEQMVHLTLGMKVPQKNKKINISVFFLARRNKVDVSRYVLSGITIGKL